MPSAIDATPGGAAANSYCTQSEANAYFDDRLALPTPWLTSGDTAVRALLMSCRVLDAMNDAHKTLRIDKTSMKYLYVSRRWRGARTTATQALCWPRMGLQDFNRNVIDGAVIPQALKNAQAELAGQLLIQDTTLDNPVLTGGITSLRASTVSISFREDLVAYVLPNTVLNLMPESWLTDEEIIPALRAELEITGTGRHHDRERW